MGKAAAYGMLAATSAIDDVQSNRDYCAITHDATFLELLAIINQYLFYQVCSVVKAAVWRDGRD